MKYKPILFLTLLVGFTTSNSVTFNPSENCYEDLLVAISPDVPSTESAAMIANIKEWITQGSEILYNATYGWAYIKSVKILLPASWEDVPDVIIADYEAFEDAEIRVENQNPIYGNFPFTMQNGGCGDPGQYIQTSAEYFAKLSQSEASVGPSGQIFVHNWAKLRYGIFEEFGYPGDTLYPMFYYQQVWTSEGQTNSLKPNLCSNMVPEGTQEDQINGDSCLYDSKSGLPDENCVYVAAGPSGLTSSIMAIPYLMGNNMFCDEKEEHIHNPDLPTKHNDICDGKSVFSVIQKHNDFNGFVENTMSKDTTPKFTLLRPGKSQVYIMVIDASNSMGRKFNRIGRVKQAVKRFIQLDLENETPLGIVKFSAVSEIEIIQPIVPVTDENRADILDIVDGITLHVQTCLGDAILKGLQALKDYGIMSGGVMIFLTDGRQSGKCGPKPNIEDVIDEVVAQNVRVVTIAFGSSAQQNIEDLARRTGGQAFFVPDQTGPEDINNALFGALAYQPSTSSENKEIVVLQKTLSGEQNILDTFSIDQYIGRDVVIELDIEHANSATNEVSIETNISGENQTVNLTIGVGVFNKTISSVDPGDYFVKIVGEKVIDFLTMKIKSKPPTGTLPLTVDCWTSIGDEDLDLSGENPAKVAVMAKVMQGQNPVIGAEVIAALDMGQGPIELVLSDEGTHSDRIKGDGIYSKYFTNFKIGVDEMRYTLKCDVVGTNTSMINQGPSRSFKTAPKSSSPQNPPCCGSSAVSDDSVLAPSGVFSRSESGGMITVGPTKGMNNIYPPGKINDLTLGNMDFKERTFEVSFTSTGEDLDEGTVVSNQLFFSTNQTLLTGDMIDEMSVELVEEGYCAQNCTLDPLPAPQVVWLPLNMDNFNISQQYYFRIKSTDKGEKFSFSNIARLFITEVSNPSNSAVNVRLDFITLILAITACFMYLY